MANRVLWSICRKLIDIARQRAIPSPELYEIVHYAICPRCRNDIEAEGWRVDFKHQNKEIYEVTFSVREVDERTQFSGECLDEEEEEEGDEDEDEFKVKMPRRLIAGEERPKRPTAIFYV